MTKEEQAQSLAFCMVRAYHISPKSKDGWPTHDNEIYWYTRESALKIARNLSIPWTKIMKEYTNTCALTYDKLSKDQIQESEAFWPDVAHPDLIIGEVMES